MDAIQNSVRLNTSWTSDFSLAHAAKAPPPPTTAPIQDGVDVAGRSVFDQLMSVASKGNAGGTFTCPSGTTPTVQPTEDPQTVKIECVPNKKKGKQEAETISPSPILK